MRHATIHLLRFAFIACALVASLAACNSEDKKTGEPKGEDAAAVSTPKDSSISTYRLDTVRLEVPFDELPLNGQVTFDQDSVSPVYPIVSGSVDKVKVSIGDKVRHGQQLATVRSGDVAGYQGAYNAAKSDFAIAEKNYLNAEDLYKAGFTSQTDFLTSKQTYTKAKDELRRATEVLRLYGGPEKADVAPGTPTYTVNAPIDGYVVSRNVNPGTQIRPDNSNPLFTISSLSKVWVMANVYEADIQKIKVGLPVNVQVLSFPDRLFQGRIDQVAASLDDQSRIMRVRITLPNPEGLIKPQMFATIRVHLAEDTTRRLSVPAKSVVFDRDHYYVIVKDGKDKFHPVEVRVLKTGTNRVFIHAPLNAGTPIVTQGALLIYNDLAG